MRFIGILILGVFPFERKNDVQRPLVIMSVLLVPAVLDYMCMSLFGYISVIKVISLFGILMNMSGWLCTLPVLLVLIMGGVMWIISNKKWKRL